MKTYLFNHHPVHGRTYDELNEIKLHFTDSLIRNSILTFKMYEFALPCRDVWQFHYDSILVIERSAMDGKPRVYLYDRFVESLAPVQSMEAFITECQTYCIKRAVPVP